MKRWMLPLLGTLACAASLHAQPATQPAGGASGGDASQVTLELIDGSIISGRLEAQDIPISTQFGDLRVPIAALVSFTPGLDSHPELTQKLDTLIEQLGAMEAGERDRAQAALRAMGPAIRAELQRRANDPDAERKLRINALLEELEEAQTEDDIDAAPQPSVGRLDEVETTDFTIAGRIVPKTFKVASPYGPLTVKLSDIRRAERAAANTGPEEVRKTIAVEGNNLVQSNFKDTGLKLNRGDKVVISADGTMTMTPWGNENISTPEGTPNCGWYINNQIPVGALVAKVGKSGTVFKVGTKHTFTAKESGTLFFAVGMHPSYANNVFPGKYTVKVRVEPKGS